MEWLNKIVLIFKIKDLRKKILFIFSIFIIFRLMASIPIPGIDKGNLENFFNQFQVFGLVNVFTGGALEKLSIVMLGLGPYITAVIILQLLTMIFPKLEKMYKEEGESGRQKFNQYGRIATVPLAMLQGYGMLALLQQQKVIESLSPMLILSCLLTVTAGTLILMWLGELITEKGIGNGVSLLIFAGIIADFPSSMRQMIMSWDSSKVFAFLSFFVIAFIIVVSVVLINEARRNIPVTYAKRVRGTKVYGGASTYLPLNINPAGVIPIIFALAILSFPGMIANFFSASEGIIGSMALWMGNFFQNPFFFAMMQFFFVFMFTFFYTAVTFDPKTISSNLQKMGGFVPGIRPGHSTAHFIYYVLYRVLPVGALFLATISIMPSIVGVITGVQGVFTFLVGGTALLIVVSVVLESMKQINAQLQMREYETF